MVGRITVPQRCLDSNPPESSTVLFYVARGTLSMWLRLRALKWGVYPEISRRGQSNHMKGRRVGQKDAMGKER